MEIHIEKPYLILKEFHLLDLPDFVVITGENGSGKTQLLNSLHFNPMANPLMPMMMPTMNPDGTMANNTSIIIDGKRVTNISSVGVNQHQFNFGQQNNQQTFMDLYGGLPLKYYSFLNLKNSNTEITTTNLINQFKKDIGYITNTNSNNNFNPTISQNDIILFNKLYELKKNKLEGVSFEECIVNLPNINNNLFSTNLTFLYFQYHNRIKLGLETIEAPWETFNKIIEAANFKYRLNIPELSNEKIDCKIELFDIENGNIIDVNHLSSGEKTIMSLLLALYNSKTDTQFPQVLIFDEPDSSLHPSMAQQMLDVLQNVFVKEKGVKVIITTHSPSTIALSPESAIYRMDRKLGILLKEEKGKAIKSLTKGLNTLSVYYENRRQIFVESSNDVTYYEKLYNQLSSYLIPEISLIFISSGESRTDKNGTKISNCGQVKNITETLRNAGNKFVSGIIDRDDKNKSTEAVKVLGNGNRYSIENYILDPLLIGALLLRDKIITKKELNLNENETFIDLKYFNQEKLQFIADYITNKVALVVNPTDNAIFKVKLLNGIEINIPNWYLNHNGHSLEEHILKTFPQLKSIKKDKEEALKIEILNKVVDDLKEILSIDILEVLKSIQTSS